MLFQRQNLLENIFPVQWKPEFQSYFSQNIIRIGLKKNKQTKNKKTKKQKKKKKKNTITQSLLLFFNGYDIQNTKREFFSVGINKTLFILFVLLCLFYLTTI